MDLPKVINSAYIFKQHGDNLKHKIKHVTSLTILTVLIAVASLAIPVQAITNGQPDAGRHPYVVFIVADNANGPAWRGTGILLNSRVVLTAGHVTDGAVATRIWIAESVEGNPEYPRSGTTSYDGTPHTHPNFAIGNFPGLPGWITHDVGIIVLTEPAPVVSKYGQLPSEDLTETLPIMTDIDLVGYGVQVNLRGGGKPVWTGLKNRLYAPADLLSTQSVISDEFITCSANPAQGKGSTAFGDSGGPALLGGTDTVLAVTSFGSNNTGAKSSPSWSQNATFKSSKTYES